MDWSALMHEVGPRFAERSRRCDANDAFVAENFAELKERGVFAAGVPSDPGIFCRPSDGVGTNPTARASRA
jgi:hypothetical protein